MVSPGCPPRKKPGPFAHVRQVEENCTSILQISTGQSISPNRNSNIPSSSGRGELISTAFNFLPYVDPRNRPLVNPQGEPIRFFNTPSSIFHPLLTADTAAGFSRQQVSRSGAVQSQLSSSSSSSSVMASSNRMDGLRRMQKGAEFDSKHLHDEQETTPSHLENRPPIQHKQVLDDTQSPHHHFHAQYQVKESDLEPALLEFEELDPGEDSGIESDNDGESITTSITSSVLNYKYENGRRYHSYREGEYWGPNDEKQLNQLDLAHHLYYLTLNGELYLAPIGNNPQRILDVGTGTGIWAIDMAYRFPSATVIGNDLSPTQPNYVPPNLYFEVDDVEAEWIHRPNSFDFVHVRGLYGCVRDWPKFYDEVYRSLKPGGFIEQVEMSVVLETDDNTIPPDGIFKLWGTVSVEAGETFGKTLKICDLMKGYIEDAGFEGVTQRVYKWPIGPWAKGAKMKEIGAWNKMQWEEGIEGWAIMLLTKVLGWSFTEVQAYLGRMRQAMNDPKQHAYHRLKVVYGRKPGGDYEEDFPGY